MTKNDGGGGAMTSERELLEEALDLVSRISDDEPMATTLMAWCKKVRAALRDSGEPRGVLGWVVVRHRRDHRGFVERTIPSAGIQDSPADCNHMIADYRGTGSVPDGVTFTVEPVGRESAQSEGTK